jgi:hypothetical protein
LRWFVTASFPFIQATFISANILIIPNVKKDVNNSFRLFQSFKRFLASSFTFAQE